MGEKKKHFYFNILLVIFNEHSSNIHDVSLERRLSRGKTTAFIVTECTLLLCNWINRETFYELHLVQLNFFSFFHWKNTLKLLHFESAYFSKECQRRTRERGRQREEGWEWIERKRVRTRFIIKMKLTKWKLLEAVNMQCRTLEISFKSYFYMLAVSSSK